MTEEANDQVEFKVDRNHLYKEETFTDLRFGSIRRLTPAKPDGAADKSRKIIFIGQTSLMTPSGPVPIQSRIQAKDLQQAIKRFPEYMEAAMELMIEEAKKFHEREQSKIKEPESRIIVPGR
ncbi:MAG: cytoplasmic protein [Deltaproteobacteria bacterium]|nr:cytoplasmic protein [Deltaproteobacteria bacterium]